MTRSDDVGMNPFMTVWLQQLYTDWVQFTAHGQAGIISVSESVTIYALIGFDNIVGQL